MPNFKVNIDREEYQISTNWFLLKIKSQDDPPPLFWWRIISSTSMNAFIYAIICTKPSWQIELLVLIIKIMRIIIIGKEYKKEWTFANSRSSQICLQAVKTEYWTK